MRMMRVDVESGGENEKGDRETQREKAESR